MRVYIYMCYNYVCTRRDDIICTTPMDIASHYIYTAANRIQDVQVHVVFSDSVLYCFKTLNPRIDTVSLTYDMYLEKIMPSNIFGYKMIPRKSTLYMPEAAI